MSFSRKMARVQRIFPGEKARRGMMTKARGNEKQILTGRDWELGDLESEKVGNEPAMRNSTHFKPEIYRQIQSHSVHSCARQMNLWKIARYKFETQGNKT